MKNLTINISGRAGDGKSALAVYLSKILNDNGFNVSLTEEDVRFENKEQNINNLKEQVCLNIITTQLGRV